MANKQNILTPELEPIDLCVRTNEIRLLCGYFEDDLPKEKPKQIRIFISSTFKDYQIERNYLIEHVYSRLRDDCMKQYQLDLYFVDMRWGITDEAAKLQLSSDICFNEIERCFEQSLGPSFVALLSHRYGSKFLRSSIQEEQFELIKSKTKPIKYLNCDSLLDYCYVLDANCIENREYKLRSIYEILKHFNIEENEWRKIEKKLSETISDAIEQLEKDLSVDKYNELKDLYLTSVTHQEIKKGILNRDNSKYKSIVLFRNIENMDNKTNVTNLHEYMEDDKIQQKYLQELKLQIENELSPEKWSYFQIDWLKSDNFVEPVNQYMSDYLTLFGKTFQSSIMSLIGKNKEEYEANHQTSYDNEVLHHSLFCNKLSSNVMDREELIEKIETYLHDDGNTNPFIITGPSGSGKSTLMAYTSRKLSNNYYEHKNRKLRKYIVLIRFMGTSRESSNILSVMKSLIRQLCCVFKVEGDFKIEDENDKVEVRNQLLNILSVVASTEQKIIILLDSIDQLSKHDYELEWMFYDLPVNVKVIYSVLPNYEGILQRIKQKFKLDHLNFLKIDEIDIKKAVEVVNRLLLSKNKRLNEQQNAAIEKCLKNTNEIHSLHVRLLFEISSKWTSSFVVSEEFSQCVDTKSTIKYIFNKLEKLHGEMLFSRCIFYVTLFEYNGISESELEDILSIDDDVLESVFVYHHPSVRRFPNSLWLFIKYELANYLTHKETDDVPVVSWFHRAFIEASKEYYQEMFKSSEEKDKILMNIIDYFTEKWNEMRSNGEEGEIKEFKYNKRKLYSFKEKGDGVTYYGYRNTKAQLIEDIVVKGDTKIMKYNKRKLNELVHIISMIHNNEKKVHLLKKFVYFNYEFMSAKANLKEMNFVIDRHDELVLIGKLLNNSNEVIELIDVSQIYSKQYQVIQQDPLILLDCVMSRLESRSQYVKEFNKVLFLLYPYIRNESNRILFANKNVNSNKFRFEHDGVHLFIDTLTNSKCDIWTLKRIPEEGSKSSLFVVNSINGKEVGCLDFKMLAEHLKIVLFDEAKENVNRINDLDGIIYFINQNTLYSATFDSNCLPLCKLDVSIIKDVFVLSKDCLLVFFENGFVLYKQNEANQEKIYFNENIEFIETTIPDDRVFTSKYLNRVGYVYVLIGLENRIVNIYRFKVNTNEFSLFCQIKGIEWKSWEYENRQILRINDSYLISNLTENKLNTIQLEFAMQCTEKRFKIVKLDNEGQYSILDEIDENKLNITQTNYYGRIQLESYFKNQLIFKKIVGYEEWYIYVYDLEKKNFYKIRFVYTVHVFGLNCETILRQRFDEFFISKMTDGNVEDIYTCKINGLHQDELNYIIRNNSLFILLQDKYDAKNGMKIIEYDYLASSSKHSNELNISDIYSIFDEKHALVRLERDDNQREFAVVDVTSQTILKSLPIEEKDNCHGAIKVFKEFLTVVDQTECCLFIYKIEMNRNQSEFDFKQIYKEQIDSILCKRIARYDYFKHYFNGSKNIFSIAFASSSDLIDIRLIEFDMNFNDYKPFVFHVDDSHKKDILGTEFLKDYFLIFKKDRLTYYHIRNGQYADSIEMNDIENVYCLKNSNNVIVVKQKSISYVEMENEIENDEKIKVKEYVLKEHKTYISGILNEGDYLLVNVNKYGSNQCIGFYKTNELHNEKVLSNPIIINESFGFELRDGYTLSLDEKYFVVLNRNNELCVYDLESEKILRKGCFKLQPSFSYDYLKSNGKYIVLRCQDKELVTFEIN